MMTLHERLLSVARAYGAAKGLSLATVSTMAAQDGKLLGRIEAGRTATMATYDRMIQWFAENWPADAEWPAGVERPSAARPFPVPQKAA